VRHSTQIHAYRFDPFDPRSTRAKEKLGTLIGRIGKANCVRPEVRFPLDGEWKLRCSDSLDDDLGGGVFMKAKGGVDDVHDCCGLFVTTLTVEPLNGKPVYKHANKERFMGWSGACWVIADTCHLADIRSGTIVSPFDGFHFSTGGDSLRGCLWESFELYPLAATFTVSAGKFELHGQQFSVPTSAAEPMEFTWLDGTLASLDLEVTEVATANSLSWSTSNPLACKVYWDRASESTHQRLLSDWRTSWETLQPVLEELHSASCESDLPVVETDETVVGKEVAKGRGPVMETMCINLGFRMLGILLQQGDAAPAHFSPSDAWGSERS
jgi:hypothetical protein